MIERDTPLADGGTFEEDSECYRVLAIQLGYGPFAGVIEAERLASSEQAHQPECGCPGRNRAASRTPGRCNATRPPLFT